MGGTGHGRVGPGGPDGKAPTPDTTGRVPHGPARGRSRERARLRRTFRSHLQPWRHCRFFGQNTDCADGPELEATDPRRPRAVLAGARTRAPAPRPELSQKL